MSDETDVCCVCACVDHADEVEDAVLTTLSLFETGASYEGVRRALCDFHRVIIQDVGVSLREIFKKVMD